MAFGATLLDQTSDTKRENITALGTANMSFPILPPSAASMIKSALESRFAKANREEGRNFAMLFLHLRKAKLGHFFSACLIIKLGKEVGVKGFSGLIIVNESTLVYVRKKISRLGGGNKGCLSFSEWIGDLWGQKKLRLCEGGEKAKDK